MTRPVLYVDCDVPEGLTLADYRAAKQRPRPRRRLRTLLRRRQPAPVVALPVERAAAPARRVA